jgi:hypothetical protein
MCLIFAIREDSLTSCDLVETLHKLALLCCECISKKNKKFSHGFQNIANPEIRIKTSFFNPF